MNPITPTTGEDHGPEEHSYPADRGWKRDSSSGHNAGWQVDKVTGRDDAVWYGGV